MTYESPMNDMSSEDESKGGDAEKKFECEFCTKKFNLHRTYSRHVVEKHKLKKYRCKVCLEEFNNRQVLKEHCEQAHQEDRVPCHLCQKTFTTKSSLRLHHEAIHKGIRYKCDHCDKSFGQLGSLRRHVNTIHDGAPILDPQLVLPTEDKENIKRQRTKDEVEDEEAEEEDENSEDFEEEKMKLAPASKVLSANMNKRVRLDMDFYSQFFDKMADPAMIKSSITAVDTLAKQVALKSSFRHLEVGPKECAAIAILVSMKA